jgi:large subunit ribosomal protein LP1
MADDHTQQVGSFFAVKAAFLTFWPPQLACVYAALILHDDGLQVTPDKLIKLLNAAKLTVNPFWPSLFSEALKNRDLTDLALSGIGAGGGGGGGGAEQAPAAADTAPKAADKKEEKKEEKKEASEEEEMELVRRASAGRVVMS